MYCVIYKINGYFHCENTSKIKIIIICYKTPGHFCYCGFRVWLIKCLFAVDNKAKERIARDKANK